MAFRPDYEFDIYAPLIDGEILSLQDWKRLRAMADRFYSQADEAWIEWWTNRKKERESSRPISHHKRKIPQPLKMAVWRRDGFNCLVCNSEERLTCDHIIPESRGGQTVEDNIQTLCKSCNSKKGVTTVDYRIQSPTPA